MWQLAHLSGAAAEGYEHSNELLMQRWQVYRTQIPYQYSVMRIDEVGGWIPTPTQAQAPLADSPVGRHRCQGNDRERACKLGQIGTRSYWESELTTCVCVRRIASMHAPHDAWRRASGLGRGDGWSCSGPARRKRRPRCGPQDKHTC